MLTQRLCRYIEGQEECEEGTSTLNPEPLHCSTRLLLQLKIKAQWREMPSYMKLSTVYAYINGLITHGQALFILLE